MNLDNIDLQGFILALFIRDDGERFLLGSGAYEFKSKQLHFTANTYQNDIVEVQGNDGLLLAGQVRRPETQTFEGYIGDATVSKTNIELYREQFLAFFRKDYYYKVVYIFPDGSAIQRRKGFIVNAPEVKELWQVFPEYSVGLNFEDINYYSYNEDDSGQEIYGKSAILPLSTQGIKGGLMWDEYGAINQEIGWTGDVTVTGSDLTVNNPLNYRVPFTDVKIYGYSILNGIPSISNPVTSSDVSGTQAITIEDANNTDTYTITFGTTLSGIGTYKDVISKSGGNWTLTQNTRVFSVSLNLTLISSTSNYIIVATPQLLIIPNLSAAALSALALCNNLPVGGSDINQIIGTDSSGKILIRISKQYASTADQANHLLRDTYILYGTTSPQTTTISGSLATELDALLNAQLFTGENTITVTPPSNAQKATLELTYYTEAVNGEGFVWEAGGGGGPTTVSIQAIDNVYPIWEIEGPAINPQLSNLTTNTTLTYTGAVNLGQTLKIDMANKLATLNGTSVVGNVSGDWIYFKPGDNRVTYTAMNGDATPSTIYWQEIVG